MAKYGNYSRRPPGKERPWEIHPVWRGIGCLLIVLIPILSYAGAVILVQENNVRGWMPVPPEFARAMVLPVLGRVPYLVANLVVAVILAVAGFVLLTVLYSIFYSLIGPSRYGPMDSPPQDSLPRRSR